MSSRDYYKRQALPPIRDVLGDQLDRPPHNSAYSFHDVQEALPSTSPPRPRSTRPPASGPTLPPINHHQGYAPSHSPYSSSSHPHPSSHSHSHAHPSSHSHAHSSHSSHGHSHSSHHSSHPSSHQHPPTPGYTAPPRAAPGPAYSFDVFRPTPAGLMHASSSDRSQGILRSTRVDAGRHHLSSYPTAEDDLPEDEREKRYPCPTCGKRFSRPSSLRTHEVVHSEAKPYECPHPGCGKTFTVPSNMRRHYRKMHEEGAGSDDDAEEPHASGSGAASYYSSARRTYP